MFEKKILVVDDSNFSARCISDILTGAGYQVIRAVSGQEGLRLVREEKPDMVLLDVVMPDISGFDVCRILREAESNNLMPIIMLTSQDNQEDKLVGLELGADDYITKPFNNREVLSRVRNTLRRIDRNRGANPLTGLPGNLEIQAEVGSRLEKVETFAAVYADLDNFKAYNDVYGFAKGDIAIKMTADILRDQIRDFGGRGDFIGHIGGDDFILITAPERTDDICKGTLEAFDRRIRTLYYERDLAAGSIYTMSRLGECMKYPIMSISLAAVVNRAEQPFSDYLQIAETAAEIKKKAKALPGSNYIIDAPESQKN